MRFLTPTANKRLNELIGFLFMILAVLVALSLISYSPHDVAFNVAAPPAVRASVFRMLATLPRDHGTVGPHLRPVDLPPFLRIDPVTGEPKGLVPEIEGDVRLARSRRGSAPSRDGAPAPGRGREPGP